MIAQDLLNLTFKGFFDHNVECKAVHRCERINCLPSKTEYVFDDGSMLVVVCLTAHVENSTVH